MQIQVLSNQVTTQTNKSGKPMQVLEVAYKNLTFQGKVESKKLFDFGVQADTFKELVVAKPSAVYEVEVVKNQAGYNDWVKVTKGVQNVTVEGGTMTPRGASSGAATAPAKGGWETPEERAKKQIYIIRQSSLSTAVAALSVGSKVHPTVKDIIEYAKQFESYVFGDSNTSEVVAKDRGLPEDMSEDIPF
jgi:hypothetical protein